MAVFQLLSISFSILAISTSATDRVCNNTHLCSNKIIDCTNSPTSCNIQCTSRESCKNTTIICANDKNCTTICSSTLACDSINIQCPISTSASNTQPIHCTINGLAPNSLHGMNFNCNAQNMDQQCNILCMNHSTCSNAIINGGNSLGPLNILCSGDDGCTDITLYCPQNSNDQKLCTVYGWNVVGSGFDTVHRNLNIYATNSWNDVNLTEYIAWVGGNSSMHCGTNYDNECLITNAAKVLQWNCVNNTSPCHFTDDSVETIRCDNDYSCNGTTIQCIENDKPCYIWCTGKYSCSNSIVKCRNNNECNIICSGEGACDSNQQKTVFNCPTDANCNIACGVIDIEYTEYGLYACRNSIINCPTNAEYNCDIKVFGDSGLQNANIECNNANQCDILCNGLAACQNTVFNGTNTQLLNIECVSNAEQSNTCSDMKIICPMYDDDNNNMQKKCIIKGSGDAHRELELFCRNSWDDINIFNYSSSILQSNLNTMNCGYNNYNNSCLLSEGLLIANSCFCDYTIPPQQSTTTLPPTVEGTDWIIIISVSIACFFFVLLALFCVLWMKKDEEMIAYEIYREKQKLKEKKTKNTYDKVENKEREIETDEQKEMELAPTKGRTDSVSNQQTMTSKYNKL